MMRRICLTVVIVGLFYTIITAAFLIRKFETIEVVCTPSDGCAAVLDVEFLPENVEARLLPIQPTMIEVRFTYRLAKGGVEEHMTQQFRRGLTSDGKEIDLHKVSLVKLRYNKKLVKTISIN